MMKKASLDFLIQAVLHPKQLGTPFQSSKYLINAIIKELSGKRIVELGAGNGGLTKGILSYEPLTQLTSFEINDSLLENLVKINDPRLKIINASAENFPDYVDDFDCVVSGLPLSSMKKEIIERILENSRKARFIQYKYFPTKMLLEEYFKSVSAKIIFRNIPPAIIYNCSNE